MESNDSQSKSLDFFPILFFGVGFLMTLMVVFLVSNEVGSFIATAASHQPLTSDGVFALVAVLIIGGFGTSMSLTMLAEKLILPFTNNGNDTTRRLAFIVLSFSGIFVAAIGIYLFTPALSRILQDPYPSIIDAGLAVCWIQMVVGGIGMSLYGMINSSASSIDSD